MFNKFAYRLKILFCLVASAIVVSCGDSANQKNMEPRTITTQTATENRVPGQYIITLKEGGNVETLHKVFTEFGVESIQDLSKDRYLITLEKDPGPEDITKQATTISDIKHVQPNYIYRTMQPAQESSQHVR